MEAIKLLLESQGPGMSTHTTCHSMGGWEVAISATQGDQSIFVFSLDLPNMISFPRESAFGPINFPRSIFGKTCQ